MNTAIQEKLIRIAELYYTLNPTATEQDFIGKQELDEVIAKLEALL